MKTLPPSENCDLPCDLTPAEVIDRAHTLAAKLGEATDVEIAKVAAARGYRERLKVLEIETHVLGAAVRDHKERRRMLCTWREHGVQLELVRPDTGEVVRSRAMTEAERQPDLFAAGAEANGAHGAHVEDDGLGDEDEAPAPPPKAKRGRPKKAEAHQ